MSVGDFDEKQHGEVSAIVARISFRSYDQATSRLGDVGFRCAQSVQYGLMNREATLTLPSSSA